jgi:FKBP-type peptidyl-prolyl cis-trans isomerase SlyD
MDENAEQTNKVTDCQCYVKIKYSVRVVDGPFLKGAAEPEVMDFVTGYGHVIPGLEKRLLGHGPGAKLSFVIPPHECFGVRHEELVIEKSKEDFHFPKGLEPLPGMEIPLVCSADVAPDTVTIREIRGDTIVIDCNHPLAGLSLKYNLEIIEARPASPTDVCAEWEEKNVESDCGCSPCQIVLGSQEIENR